MIELPTTTIEHGERFGKLTVLRPLKRKNRGPRVVVGCACGGILTVRRSHLVSGRRTACDHCMKGKE